MQKHKPLTWSANGLLWGYSQESRKNVERMKKKHRTKKTAQVSHKMTREELGKKIDQAEKDFAEGKGVTFTIDELQELIQKK